MNTHTLIPSDAIVFRNNQIRTTSLKVAKAFGKRHANVLRRLQSVECSADFNQLNFELVEYKDTKGEKRPAYEMTKDGFIFLVMGFTGAKAAQVKEAYINAFNQMASELSEMAATAESTPSIVGRRWLISYDYQGKEQVTPVSDDAYVLSHAGLLRAISSGDAVISTEELFQFVAAATDQLKRRSAYQAGQLAKARQSGFRLN